MPITVDIPNVGEVDFPDTMGPDEINAAAKRLYDEAPQGVGPVGPGVVQLAGKAARPAIHQISRLIAESPTAAKLTSSGIGILLGGKTGIPSGEILGALGGYQDPVSKITQGVAEGVANVTRTPGTAKVGESIISGSVLDNPVPKRRFADVLQGLKNALAPEKGVLTRGAQAAGRMIPPALHKAVGFATSAPVQAGSMLLDEMITPGQRYSSEPQADRQRQFEKQYEQLVGPVSSIPRGNISLDSNLRSPAIPIDTDLVKPDSEFQALLEELLKRNR